VSRKLVIGLVLSAVVLVAALLVVWWALSRPLGPEATARAFLEAVESGDAAGALALAEPPPGPDVDRAAALAGADELITDASVEDVEMPESGEGMRATVAFTLDGASRSASFGLVERDGGWRVAADAFGAVAATTTIGDAVTVGGALAPTGESVALLPAAYPVSATPEGIVTGTTSVAVLPGETSDAAVEASATPEATALAQERVDTWAEQCAQASDRVPANCGLTVPWGADLAALESIAFRIENLSRVTLSSDLTTFAATDGAIVATATGTTRDGARASFTYRSDEWALRGTVALTAEGMELAVE